MVDNPFGITRIMVLEGLKGASNAMSSFLTQFKEEHDVCASHDEFESSRRHIINGEYREYLRKREYIIPLVKKFLGIDLRDATLV